MIEALRNKLNSHIARYGREASTQIRCNGLHVRELFRHHTPKVLEKTRDNLERTKAAEVLLRPEQLELLLDGIEEQQAATASRQAADVQGQQRADVDD